MMSSSKRLQGVVQLGTIISRTKRAALRSQELCLSGEVSRFYLQASASVLEAPKFDAALSAMTPELKLVSSLPPRHRKPTMLRRDTEGIQRVTNIEGYPHLLGTRIGCSASYSMESCKSLHQF